MIIPEAINKHIDKYIKKIKPYSPKLAEMYGKCYVNTIETAAVPMNDGTYFILTGDIPAMWLRDSTAEVSHYIPVAKESLEIAALIKGVIKRQHKYILEDSYANAFKKEENAHREFDDYPLNKPIVWERKYEIDSLCYPIRLVYLFYKETGDKSILDDDFIKAAEITVNQWITEQNHFEKSEYRFTRKGEKREILPDNGMGNPVSYTGMTWSGFRPSDDDCKYGYLVASNMFAAVELAHLAELLAAADADKALIQKCKNLESEIRTGIEKYAVIEKNGKKIYACEVDGKGNSFCFDDANVPSLLSAPYLGFCRSDDELYRNTRSFILSFENPYYYEGKIAKGVGSPHTPENYIWHIALSMQGLTSEDPEEIKRMLAYLEATDSGTYLMHEGFDADNPDKFTRSWFSWSCSLFSELVEKAVDLGII